MGKVIGFDKARGEKQEPPREVWVVSSPTGPDFVASYREAAMEHASELAGEFPESGPYRVCKYVAVPFA
jgi:hypothetical protein